ncbi:MAG: phosphodiesterase [Gaiellaceae bacterium]
MTRPFLVVQLSDPHIGADWGDGDPVATLAATVAAVRAIEPSPDAVLISGDLADHAADTEYEQVLELTTPLGAPIHVLPGNHDRRAPLRRRFGLPGQEHEPVQYGVDLGPLRLVVLDSMLPGEDRGELDAGRLAWLEAALDEAPETPTILALHHPPVTTGIPIVDEIGLAPADQRALGDVVEGHPQIRRIVAGHLHLRVTAELRGRSILVAPSTYVQARLELDADEVRLSAEPPAFAVHVWLDGELVSYVLQVS